MSDSTRARIRTAFDEELSAAPTPAGLRAMSVRAAVAAPPERRPRPALLALVATLVAVALVATLVIGSNELRHKPTPARTRPAPSVLPPSPRSGAALVYDQAHGELLLFGGTNVSSKTVNETWTWDGKAWRLYHPAVAPAPRSQAAMAYDAAHKDVVLFGGVVVENGVAYVGKGSQVPSDDTWIWNGSDWKQQHPVRAPPLNFGWPAEMAYDAASKTVLLYGFESITSGNQTNMTAETWSWNGSDWTRIAAASGPTQVGTLVAESTHLYLVGAAAGRIGGRYVTQMWRWDVARWTHVSDFVAPIAGSFGYDTQRNAFIAFDGDTWIGDGTKWTRQHPSTEPRAVGYMAYFAPLHEVVMWGSYAGDTSNELWAWDGTNWKQLAAGTMPVMPPPTGQFGPVTPQAAADFIRHTVNSPCHVLLPTLLPAVMDATGVATPESFSVDYKSDQRDRGISLATVVANPPPGDDRSSDTHVAFQGGAAEYFVYDQTAAHSDRWLMWSAGNPKTDGCPYFMSASGLTDAEFWQVANSLR